MDFFLSAGTPSQFEIKKPPEQNCVYSETDTPAERGGGPGYWGVFTGRIQPIPENRYESDSLGDLWATRP